MTSNTTTQIHARALLVWLTISTWSARKYDRKVSQETNARYSAGDDAGRYNKMLLPGDAPAYKVLVQLASQIRSQHYAHTLAWSDEGWRLLPTANYMEYTKWYREQQRAFDDAIADFARDYPYLRDMARQRLNGLYRDEDYPSVLDIRGRFALKTEYSPLPATGDLRVDLGSDQIAAIEQSIQTRQQNAVQIATQDAWSRLHSVVSAISERLNNPSAIFRDSLIDNARELCSSLQRLNVTDDPNLETIRQRVLSELANMAPDVLRHQQYQRERTAKKADDILGAISQFYTEPRS